MHPVRVRTHSFGTREGTDGGVEVGFDADEAGAVDASLERDVNGLVRRGSLRVECLDEAEKVFNLLRADYLKV